MKHKYRSRAKSELWIQQTLMFRAVSRNRKFIDFTLELSKWWKRQIYIIFSNNFADLQSEFCKIYERNSLSFIYVMNVFLLLFYVNDFCKMYKENFLLLIYVINFFLLHSDFQSSIVLVLNLYFPLQRKTVQFLTNTYYRNQWKATKRNLQKYRARKPEIFM